MADLMLCSLQLVVDFPTQAFSFLLGTKDSRHISDSPCELSSTPIARRYSTSEKAKWTATYQNLRRRFEGKGVRTDARPFKSVRHYDSSSQHRSVYNNGDRRIRHPQPSEERGYRSERRTDSVEYRRPPPRSPPRRSEPSKKEAWMPRKDQEADSAPRSDPRGFGRLSVRTSRQLPVSQISHTPPPRLAREPMRTPPGTISKRNGSKERRPASREFLRYILKKLWEMLRSLVELVPQALNMRNSRRSELSVKIDYMSLCGLALYPRNQTLL
ncbi:hypothetical protein YC2023_010681 [Brassica napus]